MPTTVSTALVPRKKAATWPAGTAWPVTGRERPGEHGGAGPDRGGRERQEAAAGLGPHHEQDRRGRGGQPERGEEAAERGEPAEAAQELPRQHAARIGAGLTQRRAARADSCRDRPQPRHARDDGGERQHAEQRRHDPDQVGHAGKRREPERQRQGQHRGPDRELSRALGHQRAGQQRAAGFVDAAAQQQHAHRVARAGGSQAAGARARDPGGDRLAPAEVAAARGAHERAPAAAARHLVRQVQHHPQDQPPQLGAGDRLREARQRTLKGSRQLDGRVPHAGMILPTNAPLLSTRCTNS